MYKKGIKECIARDGEKTALEDKRETGDGRMKIYVSWVERTEFCDLIAPCVAPWQPMGTFPLQ